MPKTPQSTYDNLLADGKISADEQQARAIAALNQVFVELTQDKKKFFSRRKKTVKGLYMWGSVGIGKTFLMDLFYDHLEVPKLRMHFFAFMRNTHLQLNQLQGQKNPLQHIAEDIADRYRVICFDEFFVTNITDAMILGDLFKHLFDLGIVLIATSNTAPDNLYKDGLQRERFLPAIEAIKQHSNIMHLAHKNDYRQLENKPAKVYFFPLNDFSSESMRHAFDYYSHGKTSSKQPLLINTHHINVINRCRGVLWCHFDELCIADCSHSDYLEIAKHFHTLLLDGVTTIAANDRKTILRFVHLIDILYDNHVRLIISADIAAKDIYPEGPHAFEFQRTLSRLIEMQSEGYFNPEEAL